MNQTLAERLLDFITNNDHVTIEQMRRHLAPFTSSGRITQDCTRVHLQEARELQKRRDPSQVIPRPVNGLYTLTNVWYVLDELKDTITGIYRGQVVTLRGQLTYEKHREDGLQAAMDRITDRRSAKYKILSRNLAVSHNQQENYASEIARYLAMESG